MANAVRTLGGFLAAAAMFAAQGDRQVDCGIATSSDAAVISKITVGNARVQCMWSPPLNSDRGGRFQGPPRFQAGDSWLQEVTIYLLNRTNKTIVYAELNVGLFPQIGNDGSPAPPQQRYSVILGRRPEVANFSSRTGEPMPQHGLPLTFTSNQTQVVRLSDYTDEIANIIRRTQMGTVNSISVLPTYFVFDDGMSWNPGGRFQVPDEEHHGKWKLMPGDYFPGDVRANWPLDRLGANRP